MQLVIQKSINALSLQQRRVCLDAEQQKEVDGASYEATDSQLQSYLSALYLAMLGLGPRGGHFSFASWPPVRCFKADRGGGDTLLPVLLAVLVGVSAAAFHFQFPAFPTLLASASLCSLSRGPPGQCPLLTSLGCSSWLWGGLYQSTF